MARSGNDTQTSQRLYQRARQMALRGLAARHAEEFAILLHDYCHEVGAAHIHRPEDHEHEERT